MLRDDGTLDRWWILVGANPFLQFVIGRGTALYFKGMDSVEETFEEIEELVSQCKYRKCDHIATEGCALQQAIEEGEVEQTQVDNFLKILREQDFERGKLDKDYGVERKARIKKTQKGYKKILEEKYKYRDRD